MKDKQEALAGYYGRVEVTQEMALCLAFISARVQSDELDATQETAMRQALGLEVPTKEHVELRRGFMEDLREVFQGEYEDVNAGYSDIAQYLGLLKKGEEVDAGLAMQDNDKMLVTPDELAHGMKRGREAAQLLKHSEEIKLPRKVMEALKEFFENRANTDIRGSKANGLDQDKGEDKGRG